MICCIETPAAIDREDREMMQSLCSPGSDMQREFTLCVSETPLAVIYDDEAIAWAATHQWSGYQTLEMFVHPDHRREGLGRAAAAMLLAGKFLNTQKELAVFSAECVPLARSLGFVAVLCFQRVGDEWEAV
jgi:GNAT superfamily N-acetyltransferase